MSRLAALTTVAALLVALVLLLPGPLAAQPPVMGVYGTATVDGEPIAQGTEVVAFIEGQVVARTTAAAGGAYDMRIADPGGTPYATYVGKIVSFSIGGQVAREVAVWQPGENRSLNLTVIRTSPVASALASIAGQYTLVWGFDAERQQWQVHSPATPSVSDLTALVRGRGYWIQATQDTTLSYGGSTYALSRGWNLIGWLG